MKWFHARVLQAGFNGYMDLTGIPDQPDFDRKENPQFS